MSEQRRRDYREGMRSALAAAAVLIVLTPVASGSAAPTPSLPRVTIIADSAFGAVTGSRQPLAVVKSGFAIDIDVGICRRLTGTSCPFDEDVAPPTLVDVVHSLGPTIAPTVVVEVGYNEFADTFPQSVEAAITTLLGAGVTKILWLTLADGRPQYVPMNQVLVAAASRHPELELVDWAAASRGHDSWFQGDSVHLTYDGALGMAQLLHAALMEALVPPLVVSPDQASGRARRQAVLGATQSPRRNPSVPLASDVRPTPDRSPPPRERPRDRHSSPSEEARPQLPHHRRGRTDNAPDNDHHDRRPVADGALRDVGREAR